MLGDPGKDGRFKNNLRFKETGLMFTKKKTVFSLI
jgi:hypothetical protein